eukprot:g6305.t1
MATKKSKLEEFFNLNPADYQDADDYQELLGRVLNPLGAQATAHHYVEARIYFDGLIDVDTSRSPGQHAAKARLSTQKQNVLRVLREPLEVFNERTREVEGGLNLLDDVFWSRDMLWLEEVLAAGRANGDDGDQLPHLRARIRAGELLTQEGFLLWQLMRTVSKKIPTCSIQMEDCVQGDFLLVEAGAATAAMLEKYDPATMRNRVWTREGSLHLLDPVTFAATDASASTISTGRSCKKPSTSTSRRGVDAHLTLRQALHYLKSCPEQAVAEARVQRQLNAMLTPPANAKKDKDVFAHKNGGAARRGAGGAFPTDAASKKLANPYLSYHLGSHGGSHFVYHCVLPTQVANALELCPRLVADAMLHVPPPGDADLRDGMKDLTKATNSKVAGFDPQTFFSDVKTKPRTSAPGVQRSLYDDVASGGCRMLPHEFRDLLLCKGAPSFTATTASTLYGASCKQFEYDSETEAFRNRVGAFLCNGLRCSYLIDAETLTFGADSASQFNLNGGLTVQNKISDHPLSQLGALRGSGWMRFRVGFHALVLEFDPERDLEGDLKAAYEEMQRVEKLSPEEQAEEKVAEIEKIIEGESDWRGIGEVGVKRGEKANGIGSGVDCGNKQQDGNVDEYSTSSGSEDEDEDYGGSRDTNDSKYYKDPFGSKNGGRTPGAGGGHATEYSTDDDADIPDLVDVAQWNSKTRINKKDEEVAEQPEQSSDLASPPSGDCRDNKATSTKNSLQEPQQREDEKLVQELPLPPLTLEFARELKATRHARKLFVGDNENINMSATSTSTSTTTVRNYKTTFEQYREDRQRCLDALKERKLKSLSGTDAKFYAKFRQLSRRSDDDESDSDSDEEQTKKIEDEAESGGGKDGNKKSGGGKTSTAPAVRVAGKSLREMETLLPNTVSAAIPDDVDMLSPPAASIPSNGGGGEHQKATGGSSTAEEELDRELDDDDEERRKEREHELWTRSKQWEEAVKKSVRPKNYVLKPGAVADEHKKIAEAKWKADFEKMHAKPGDGANGTAADNGAGGDRSGSSTSSNGRGDGVGATATASAGATNARSGEKEANAKPADEENTLPAEGVDRVESKVNVEQIDLERDAVSRRQYLAFKRTENELVKAILQEQEAGDFTKAMMDDEKLTEEQLLEFMMSDMRLAGDNASDEDE